MRQEKRGSGINRSCSVELRSSDVEICFFFIYLETGSRTMGQTSSRRAALAGGRQRTDDLQTEG